MMVTRMIYTGDTLKKYIKTTVAIGNIAVFQFTLALMNILMEGDRMSATTQGRMPLKMLSITGLSL